MDNASGGALFALPARDSLNRRRSLLRTITLAGDGEGGCVFFRYDTRRRVERQHASGRGGNTSVERATPGRNHNVGTFPHSGDFSKEVFTWIKHPPAVIISDA